MGRRAVQRVKSGPLPKEVATAAGTLGLKHAQVTDWNVGSEFVVLVTDRGERHTFELKKLGLQAAMA